MSGIVEIKVKLVYNKLMYRFRFKFTPLIWVLLSVVLALSLAGFGWNIYNIISLNNIAIAQSTTITQTFATKFIVGLIMLLVTLVLVALVLSIMLGSKYSVKKGYVYCYFGVIRSKTAIKEIVSFARFKNGNKLVAYFDDKSYALIIISPDKYDAFVCAVRSFNDKIVFEENVESPETLK